MVFVAKARATFVGSTTAAETAPEKATSVSRPTRARTTAGLRMMLLSDVSAPTCQVSRRAPSRARPGGFPRPGTPSPPTPGGLAVVYGIDGGRDRRAGREGRLVHPAPRREQPLCLLPPRLATAP